MYADRANESAIHLLVRLRTPGPVIFAALLLAVTVARVRAQEPAAAAPALQPPALIRGADAAYPEQAKAAGREGTVVVQLTIDAGGRVSAADVIEPLGDGFDEAAREAALRLQFEPARRDGAPIAAKLRYAFEFRLPAPSPVHAPSEPAPPPTPVSPAPTAAVQAAAPVEVTVAGELGEGARLQQSAEAVNVIDTTRAQRQTADLGEVLARTQGISVRRSGGLGSPTRFSLNGMYDEQVRFFLDGLPLDIGGYPFGVANVPVNLVERVEVYRGVVPIRFGADALGGAVNLVSEPVTEPGLSASYQFGSFGTHRITSTGRYRDANGIWASIAAFTDTTKNNYDVEVNAPDARGRPSLVTVPRFHDAYRAYGATLEAGVTDRPWAKRLLLRGTLASYDKEMQTNAVMSAPYGEARYGETLYGINASYQVALHETVELDVVAGYGRRSMDFLDVSRWVYDWYGKRLRENRTAGELQGSPTDQTEWQHSLFARALATWAITPEHRLRLALTPTFTTRTGTDRTITEGKADPLHALRDVFSFVSGLEYEANVLDRRVSNVLFVKDYFYEANSDEPLTMGGFRERRVERHRQGIGDALRVYLTPWLYAKASYEFATRLPSPMELFGNGAWIKANLDLSPEISHNANLGPRLELRKTPIGDLVVDINGFWRDAENMILLLNDRIFYAYRNVYSARSIGLENAVSWASPGRWLNLEGTYTWQDQRNLSKRGEFMDVNGDRIPNRPYEFASWSARVRVPNLPGPSDTLEPFYAGRYVRSFFRAWESRGEMGSKQRVAAQLTHSAGISWTVQRDFGRVTTTFEVDNFTNAKVYDNFGVQRPGRAFYLKLIAELR